VIRLVVLGSPSTYAPPCRECQTPASSHWHGRDISRRAFPEPPLLITAFLAKLLAQKVGGLLEGCLSVLTKIFQHLSPPPFPGSIASSQETDYADSIREHGGDFGSNGRE
jgi:hypothetical protein